MDGVRIAKGVRGVTGAMIRARIWVAGRLGAVCRRFWGHRWRLQWLWRARWRDRTRQDLADCAGASLRGTLGWLVGQWRTGAVRLGVEWVAVGPGRG